MNLKLLCIVLLVFGIKSYGQTSPDQNVTWTHYENLNYSISYPETWRLDTSHMMASDFFIFSRKEDSSDLFMENVNLMSYDLQGQSITLDSFVHTSEKQISTMANDYKILHSARLQGQGETFTNWTLPPARVSTSCVLSSIIFFQKASVIPSPSPWSRASTPNTPAQY